MDLSNPSQWVLRYLQSFTSESIRALDLPIPTFETSEFGDRFIRVRVTNSFAKTNWVYAGKAKQVVNAGGVPTITNSKSLELNNFVLWDLQGFDSYKLRISFPRYFTQATISIFGYIGPIPDLNQTFILGL